MITTTIKFNPNESRGNSPEYLIPEHVSITSEGSSRDPGSAGSTTEEGSYQYTRPLAVVALLEPLKGRYTILQKWEGQVIDVRESEFDAIIIDKTHPEHADELVTIEKSEISKDDLPLIRKGSVFYWSIGYSDYPGRGRKRESEIRFRRLKGWTKREIEKSKKIGAQFAEFFKSNSECPTERE